MIKPSKIWIQEFCWLVRELDYNSSSFPVYACVRHMPKKQFGNS